MLEEVGGDTEAGRCDRKQQSSSDAVAAAGTPGCVGDSALSEKEEGVGEDSSGRRAADPPHLTHHRPPDSLTFPLLLQTTRRPLAVGRGTCTSRSHRAPAVSMRVVAVPHFQWVRDDVRRARLTFKVDPAKDDVASRLAAAK